MTREEYAEFKKKTGNKEPQKVTTYYSEGEKDKKGRESNESRRQSNLKARDSQEGIGAKLKRALGGAKEQRVTTHYKETGVKPREAPRKPSHPVRSFLHETSATGMGFNIRPPSGGSMMGMNMPPSWMTGMPGMNKKPRATQRKKRKKTRRDDYDEGGYQELGAIPDHVKRWMF